MKVGALRTLPMAALPDGEAEAAEEFVLAVVDEGPQRQREGEGGQLLLQHGPHLPAAVH